VARAQPEREARPAWPRRLAGQRRGLSRRRLLGAALGLAASPLLAACQPLASSGPSIVGGGRLAIGLSAEPAGLDPLLQTGLVEAGVYANVFDPLVGRDPDGRLQPALAESYRPLDALRWEFSLRQDVRFHNGEPFDAGSVRATIERMLDPASGSVVRPQLTAIERVETPERYRAIVVTRQPFAPLLAELTQLMMLPPGALAAAGPEGFADRPIGTGPFRLVEWARDDRLALEAFPEHWRGGPSLRRLVFRPLPDIATRAAAFRAGELDLATNLLAHQARGLAERGLRLAERPGVQALYLRLHARKPPLDDPRVRQAIVQAVDLDRLLATLYQGHARRINGPYPPEVFGYDHAAPLQVYDPERARALLREAGLTSGAALTLETPRGRYPGDDQVAQAIAEQLGRVGLRVEIRAVEWGAYLARVQAGQGEHLFLLAGTNRTFDPHFTIVRLYASAAPFGRDYYGNPRIDGLADEAAATLEPDRRRALYSQILAILRSEAPALWIGQLADLYGLNARLDWTPRADGLLWMHQASLR
jgi:peptide/nickel transport system substrate-binding protein